MCFVLSRQVKAAPDWQGLESFEGTVTHSSEYKSNEPFVGKKVVLVGAGESGSDIAYMISCVASQAWISIRSHPGFIIPRQVGRLDPGTQPPLRINQVQGGVIMGGGGGEGGQETRCPRALSV